MLELVLWCFGAIFLFLSRTVNSEIFSEKWALAWPESIANGDLLFKPWEVDPNSWMLGTQMPGIYIAPSFRKLHGTASKAANRWCCSSRPADGLHYTTSQLAEVRLGQTRACWFPHLSSEQIHPVLCFTGARDYLWVSAGLISLQYRVYASYCRGAFENITVYNDFPQENQNQNNNELE